MRNSIKRFKKAVFAFLRSNRRVVRESALKPSPGLREWRVLEGGCIPVTVIQASTRFEAENHPEVTRCNNPIVRAL